MSKNVNRSIVPPATALPAPDYGLHREAVTAPDPALTDAFYENIRLGISMRGYEKAHISVAPTGGANPSIEVLVWSPGLERFVALNPSSTFAGTGPNTGYDASFQINGRLMFVRVTALTAGSVDIHVSGGSVLDHEV